MKTTIHVEASLAEIMSMAIGPLADAHNVLNENVTLTVRKEPVPVIPFSLSAHCPLVAIQYMLHGDKIAAIKKVREVYSWGIKESKDYIEHVAELLQIRGFVNSLSRNFEPRSDNNDPGF